VIKIKIFLIALLFIVACTPTLDCEAPYINSEDGCCMDEDSNSICDEKDLLNMQNGLLKKLSEDGFDSITQEESKYINGLFVRDLENMTPAERAVYDSAKAKVSTMTPSDFLPEKCTFPSGLACLDFGYNDTVWIHVNNAGGFDMLDAVVNLDSDLCNSTIEIDNFVAGEERIFNFGCPGLTGDVKGLITVSYTNSETALRYDKKGELIMKV